MFKICGKFVLLCFAILMITCANNQSKNEKGTMKKGTFGYDKQFLKKYTDVVELSGKDSLGNILVTPTMQGRVMTSTVDGAGGKSLGWVNHDLIASGEIQEHFTPYGGEDRFWIGPEGGQYSVFIQPGKEMVFENWFVPAGFNTEPWELVSQSETRVTVEKQLNLTNYSETEFDLQVTRSVELFDRSQIENILELQLPEGIRQVGYVSENTIENTGNQAWAKETGAPAIWILSMFTPAPGITVVVPYKKGSTEEFGPVVTTEYFGEISSDRLKIEDGIIYFKVDGRKRRKLGVSPLRALPVAGSYDETNNILTIINYTFPKNNTDYLNQLWKQQDEPYKGNIVFAYNDGPLEDGSQLGPFFELESSSPAAFLKPDESLTHDHRVFHFTGDEQALNQISEEVLGVSLNNVKEAFK